MQKILCMVLLLGSLISCSSEPVWQAEPQKWEQFTIHYETRPETIREGMNEFLVIVNRKGKRYIPDLLIHIRTEDSQWRQAIPDGALGVYRRALSVRNHAKPDHLYVRLAYHGKQGELKFDLVPKNTPIK